MILSGHENALNGKRFESESEDELPQKSIKPNKKGKSILIPEDIEVEQEITKDIKTLIR